MKTVRGNTRRIEQVRLVLKSNPDGLSVNELVKQLGIHRTHLSRILNGMPDSYIDRWEAVKADRWYAAVWCVVEVPENCPRPSRPSTRKDKNGKTE